jgi:DNA-binding response OmpR family regulator
LKAGTLDAPRWDVASTLPSETPDVERRMRVLLAEDDREMRRLLVATLRKENCEVIEAKNGAQLWDILMNKSAELASSPAVIETFDLVISDVRMPGKSGLEVLSGLRRTDGDIPVILITAFGDNDTHAEAYRLGALAVFNKPFDLDDLRTIVVSLKRL